APPLAATVGSTSHSEAEVQASVKQLLALLEDGDSSAVSYLNDHDGLLRQHLGRHYPAFAKALKDFEFTDAAAMLKS
ncbi:hypothetical protein RZS08_10090, partial [Arthrospira platensis SPKY1]|nr:hypothetical protein [Arthrospira platensis SPKY1]